MIKVDERPNPVFEAHWSELEIWVLKEQRAEREREMEEQEQEEGVELERFLKWAADLGISDSTDDDFDTHTDTRSCLGHSLSLSYFPQAGGRGLGASRDLRNGDLILRVPKSAFMTKDTLFNNLSLPLQKLNFHASSLSSTQVRQNFHSFIPIQYCLFIWFLIENFSYFWFRYSLSVYYTNWVKERVHGGTLISSTCLALTIFYQHFVNSTWKLCKFGFLYFLFSHLKNLHQLIVSILRSC